MLEEERFPHFKPGELTLQKQVAAALWLLAEGGEKTGARTRAQALGRDFWAGDEQNERWGAPEWRRVACNVISLVVSGGVPLPRTAPIAIDAAQQVVPDWLDQSSR